MAIKVEVLYAPTCASSLMWLGRIRKAIGDFGDAVTLEEIDVSESPEMLKKYPSCVWEEFLDGHIHYLTLVVVDGKALEDWYWDTRRIVEAIRRQLEFEKEQI